MCASAVRYWCCLLFAPQEQRNILATAVGLRGVVTAPSSALITACCFASQEQRNILAIAVGLRGIAAMRAVLNWAPVQAHATSHRVSCVYVTKSPSSAAFLAEWHQ